MLSESALKGQRGQVKRKKGGPGAHVILDSGSFANRKEVFLSKEREETDDVPLPSQLEYEYVVLNPRGYHPSRPEQVEYVNDVFRLAGLDYTREFGPPTALGVPSLVEMHLENIERRRIRKLDAHIRCVPILPLRDDVLNLVRILQAFGEHHLQDVFADRSVAHISVDANEARGVLLISTLPQALLLLIKNGLVPLTGAIGKGGIVRLNALAFFTMFCEPPKRTSRDILAGKLKKFIRGARLPTSSGTTLMAAKHTESREDEFDSERPTGRQSMAPPAPATEEAPSAEWHEPIFITDHDDDSPTIEVKYGELSTTSLEAVHLETDDAPFGTEGSTQTRRKPRLSDLPPRQAPSSDAPWVPTVRGAMRWKVPEPADHPTQKLPVPTVPPDQAKTQQIGRILPASPRPPGAPPHRVPPPKPRGPKGPDGKGRP